MSKKEMFDYESIARKIIDNKKTYTRRVFYIFKLLI